jgi:hypothetical protein
MAGVATPAKRYFFTLHRVVSKELGDLFESLAVAVF